jgi:hypothetical protein
MRSIDLDDAVRAGVLRADTADALRRFEEKSRNAPVATEERFGIVDGLADVMASVGLLLAGGTIAGMMGAWPILGLLWLPLCWMAARYFTERRRLTLTSFVIFFAFILGIALGSMMGSLLLLGHTLEGLAPGKIPPIAAVVAAASTTVAAYVYWKRFRLPIAFAAAAVALINLAVNVLRLAIPEMASTGVELVMAMAGPALFAVAMWWDISDVRRETMRSDVAFWLHVAAGFLIVKAAMALLVGRTAEASGWERMFIAVNQDSSGMTAVGVVAIFAVFSLVALIIDRRSLLTAGMFYAVPALGALAGGLTGSIGPAFLATGLFLTALAVKWGPIRGALLRLLPDRIAAQLPRVQIEARGSRPVY